MPSSNDTTLTGNLEDRHHSRQLDELIAQYNAPLAAGQAPSRNAFIAEHPQFAVELTAYFSAQDAEKDLYATSSGIAFDPHATSSVNPLSPSDLRTTGSFPTSENAPRTRYIGDFELLEEIARGGMGVVFKARQLSVGRLVALKMMLSGAQASEAESRRFQGEVEAAANLDHPNIVPIYEVGKHEGQPYFAMRYLDGPTLKSVPRGTPRQEAERLATIAKAVHFAHQRGILHRDLKPGNILTDAAGEPFVTDFGLARRMDADETFTQTGAILGTPAYMAPEQAAGKKAISLGADVYALGVILFERLTGRLPFRADSQHELLRQVREDEPPRLSSITPGLPRDLETICLKCLRKEPGERYASASEFEQDLTRYLSGNTILARPFGNVERAMKWVKRNPMVTTLTAAVFLAMGIGTTVSWLKYREAEQARMAETNRVAERDAALLREEARGKERDQALSDLCRREADLITSGDELRHNLGNTHMMLANVAYDNHDLRLSQEYLDRVPEEHQNFEWGYRQRQVIGGLFTLYGHIHDVKSVAFSPDGARIVTGSDDKWAKVWDAKTGQSLLNLIGHTSGVSSVAFSPDGTRIVTGSRDKTAKVWDAKTGRSLLDLRGHTSGVTSVAFSSDGDRIVTGSDDMTAKVWDTKIGQSLLDLKWHTSSVLSVAFSPDGARIVTGSRDRTAKLWDAKTGQSLLGLRGHTRSVSSVAFSPDGARIVTGSWDMTAKVWDAKTGQSLLDLRGHMSLVSSVAFSPDAARIVTGSLDDAAKVWDAKTGQSLLDLRGHVSAVSSVAFSPDGARIVTGSEDSTTKMWDAKTGQSLLDLRGHTSFVSSVAFSPDGARIVTGSRDRTAKLWDAKTGQSLLDLTGHTSFVSSVAFSPDSARIVTGSDDRTAKVWDAKTGQSLLDLKGHTSGVVSVAFSSDGARIVTGSTNRTTVWDAKTGQSLLDLKERASFVSSLAFSPKGARIVTGSWDRSAKVWDAKTGQSLLDLKGHTGAVSSVAFSPDGFRIVTGSRDKTAKVWDAKTGQSLLDLRGHRSDVTSVAFSPDGARIVTGSDDRTAKVWDAKTGQSLLDLKGHTSAVSSVAFSPDGARIVTGSWDRTAKVWDAKTGQSLLYLRGHRSDVKSMAFSSDGDRIVTWSEDTTKVWDTKTGQELKGEPIPKGYIYLLTSPDGQFVPRAHGIRVVLIPMQLTSKELEYRLYWTTPKPQQSQQAFEATLKVGDTFARRYHLDRLLSFPTNFANSKLLTERNTLVGDPRLMARAAFHTPALAAVKQSDLLTVLAASGDRLAQRLVAQELIRDGKPEKAVPMLFWCLASRMLNSPPVEELLISQAYQKMNRLEEAKRYYGLATEWLDRPRKPMAAANVVTHAFNPWAALGEAFKPIDDPRHNTFDWESWYECDVFRAVLAKAFEPR